MYVHEHTHRIPYFGVSFAIFYIDFMKWWNRIHVTDYCPCDCCWINWVQEHSAVSCSIQDNPCAALLYRHST